MGFALGDVVVDRILYGWAESPTTGTPLWVLTQLSEGSIEITAESQDATDAQGNLIKRFWKSKAGTFNATNALINFNLVAASSGIDAVVASDGAIVAGDDSDVAVNAGKTAIVMPKITTIAGGGIATLDGYVEGTIHVKELQKNGALSAATYTASATSEASESTYVIAANGSFKAPLAPESNPNIRFIVKYDREVEDGAVIRNRADKFPGTVKLTLKVLVVDPCEIDVLRAAYVVMESFQPSPEMTIDFSTENSQLDFSGELQINYCSDEKELYSIYMADEEDED